MSDIHAILVAVDFSSDSNAALEQAAALAERLGAKLDVLHVWQVPEFVPLGERSGEASAAPLAQLVETQALRQLDEFVAGARSRGIAVANAFAEPGVPYDAIVETARRREYGLLVTGTRGRTGLGQALLGSVAERVVRRAPCPVMTVRRRVERHSLAVRRILVPVDYSEGSRRALDFATELARSCRAELDVVHVWEHPHSLSGESAALSPGEPRRPLGELIRERAARQMKEFLTPVPAVPADTLQFPPHRLLSGEPVPVLLAELEKGAHDLVVVGTHGRSGLRRFLIGSVAERLVRHAPTPVVTVPAGASVP